jgi:flagellar biosynthesis protein FlhF
MNVKKFTAATSREALRRVREALGPDAVILSNRATESGVEILALASEDISSLSEPSMEKEMAAIAPFPSRQALPEPAVYGRQDSTLDDGFDLPVMGGGAGGGMGSSMGASNLPGSMHGAGVQGLAGAMQAKGRFADGIGNPGNPGNPGAGQGGFGSPIGGQGSERRFAQPFAESLGQSISDNLGGARHNDNVPDMAEMMHELRAMRGMMETQLAELAWNATQKREPQKGMVLRELLGAGFSPSLSRYLLEKMPELKTDADAMRWLKTILGRNLTTMSNEHEILEKGGVFALVGPTGVGKTTSTAKLAARCVMRHGTDKLALITTDGYRIGGHEQLRIYGKILGVMVHSVKDEADLRIALRELRGKHTVLIDTIGVSQRDNMVAEQVAMLSGSGTNVQRLLCLNATSTGETLSEVVRAYQGSGLTGCIMTKLDEAATIGNVLDVIIRAKLNLYYVSNGQRVPEDLHLGDAAYLLDRAFKHKPDHGTWQFQDAELPLIMAQQASLQARQGAAYAGSGSSREVHLG